MSVATRNPLRLAGAVLHSGGINTGELLYTLGGQITASIYSGALAPSLNAAPGATGGPDVLFFSGAGRLKGVTLQQTTSPLSGPAIFFYDTGVVTSGGPFIASGHKILAVVNPIQVSGAWNAQSIVGPYVFDVPFQSGLAVALKSGQPGFSATYTPEVNPNLG